MSKVKMNRTIVTEASTVERGNANGGYPQRALTLAEKLHRAEVLIYEEWQAAGTLRNLYPLLEPLSESVGSYGNSPGRADPSRKADRKAKHLTGIEMLPDAQVTREPSGNNRSNQWRLHGAIFAMAGLQDDEGQKVVDPAGFAHEFHWLMHGLLPIASEPARAIA